MSWGTGIIKPFYKKGDHRNPNNNIIYSHNIITLLPIIGKLFTQVLSNKISLWAENHDNIIL